MRLAEANSQRQVANLKAQGEYLLAQKAKEVERLAQEKAAQAARADAKELELLQELGCVYEYANRLAKIVENVESGKYNIKALRGKKVYQIPGRDKPVPLDMDRLQHLSMKLSQTAKFQEEQLADSSSGAEDDERPAGRAREVSPAAAPCRCSLRPAPRGAYPAAPRSRSPPRTRTATRASCPWTPRPSLSSTSETCRPR